MTTNVTHPYSAKNWLNPMTTLVIQGRALLLSRKIAANFGMTKTNKTIKEIPAALANMAG